MGSGIGELGTGKYFCLWDIGFPHHGNWEVSFSGALSLLINCIGMQSGGVLNPLGFVLRIMRLYGHFYAAVCHLTFRKGVLEVLLLDSFRPEP